MYRSVCVLLTLLVLTLVVPRGQACPRSCNCYQASEVHCTFRSLLTVPSGLPVHTRRINLGFNSISSIHDSSLAGLKKVELLMLHSNDLHQLPDEAFRDMKSLQILKLSYNKLREISSSLTFSGLTSLLRLYLDHNLLQHIHPRALLQLTSLRLLRLQGNRLHQLHPHTLCTLSLLNTYYFSTLRHLDLSNNSLTTLPRETLATAPLLETLALQGNPWSCDCRMNWFLTWSLAHPGLMKCPGGPQCPICASPSSLQGQGVLDRADLSCTSPVIPSPGRDAPLDAEPSEIQSSESFREPLGTATLDLSDQQGNSVELGCNITHSSDSQDIAPPPDLSLSSSSPLPLALSLSLECPVERQSYETLWRILAYYSETAVRLEREIMLSKAPALAYRYRQVAETDGYYHTGVKASVKARPQWLLQPAISIQLNRAQSNGHKVQLIYSTRVAAHPDPAASTSSHASHPWVLISTNLTTTALVAVAGSKVELSCPVLSSGNLKVQWVLPDGSELISPSSSPDGRLRASTSGLLLHNVQLSDAGIYYCIAQAGRNVDVLPQRLAVEESSVPPSGEQEGPPVTGDIGEPVSLSCKASGSPAPHMSWVLPDGNIVRRGLAVSGGLTIQSNGSLSLPNPSPRDAGHYRCIAVNQYGSDSLSVQLEFNSRHLPPLMTSYPTGPQSAAGRSTRIRAPLLVDEGSGDEEEEEEGTLVGNRRRTKPLQPPPNRRYPIGKPRRRGPMREGSPRRGGGPVSATDQRRNRFENRRRVTTNKQRIDPQKWADILAKIRQKTVNTNDSQPSAAGEPTAGPLGGDTGRHVGHDDAERGRAEGAGVVAETEGSTIDDADLQEEGLQLIHPVHTKMQTHTETNADTEIKKGTETSTETQTDIENETERETETASPQTETASNPETQKEAVTSKPISGTNEIVQEPGEGDEPEANTNPTRTSPQSPRQGLYPNLVPNSRPQSSWNTRRRIGQRRRIINRTRGRPLTPPRPLPDPTNPRSQTETPDTTTDQVNRLLLASTTTSPAISLTRSDHIGTAPNDVTLLSPPVSNTGTSTSKSSSPSLTPSASSLASLSPSHIKIHIDTVTHSANIPDTTESTLFNTPTPPAPTHSDTAIAQTHAHDIQTHTKTHTALGKHVDRPPGKHSEELERNLSGVPHVSHTSTSLSPTLSSIVSSTVASADTTTAAKITTTPSTTLTTSTSTTTLPTTSTSIPMTTSPIMSTTTTIIIPTSSTTRSTTTTLTSTTTTTTTTPILTSTTPTTTTTSSTSPSTTTIATSTTNSFKAIPTTPNPTTTTTTTTATTTTPTSSTTIAIPAKTSPTITTAATPSTSSTTTTTTKTTTPTSSTTIAISVKTSPTTTTAATPSTSSTTTTTTKTTIPTSSTTIAISAKTSPTTTTAATPSTSSATTTTTMTSTSTTASSRERLSVVQVDPRGRPVSGGPNQRQPSTDWKNPGTNSIPDSHSSRPHRPASPSVPAAPGAPVVRSRPRIADPHIRTVSFPAESTVRLACEAKGEPKPSITWTKVATGAVMSIHSRAQRFEVLPNGTLVIQNVQLQDRGTYICSAHSFLGRDRLLTTLEVWTRPPRMQLASYREATIHQGGEVRLECRADGVPSPLISWVLPDRSVLTSAAPSTSRITMDKNGTLHISVTLPSDRGVYRCVASNPAGAASASARVHVSSLPPVIQQPREEHLLLSPGRPVYAHCSARGAPPPTLRWRIPDGTLVRPSQFLHGNLFVLPNGTLHIRGVGPKDSGNYECSASNAVGADKRTVRVEIEGERRQGAARNEGASSPSSSLYKDRTLSIPSHPSRPSISARLSPPSAFDRARTLPLTPSSSSNSPPKINKTVTASPTYLTNIDKTKLFPLSPPSTLPTTNTKVSPGIANNPRVTSSSSSSSDKSRVSAASHPLPVSPFSKARIVSTSPSITTVHYGEFLQLHCSVTGNPSPVIIWRTPIRKLVDMHFSFDRRLKVHPNGTLSVQAVTEKDAGDYLCITRNKVSDDYRLLRVSVAIKPAKIEPKQPLNQMVSFGKPLKVDCQASGLPDPAVRWSLPDGTMVNSVLQGEDRGGRARRLTVFNNGTLLVQAVGMGEEGEYTCYAENQGGQDTMKVKVKVMMTSPPTFPDDRSHHVIKVRQGATATIRCQATGVPAPTVTWFSPTRRVIPRSSGSGFYSERVVAVSDGTLQVRLAQMIDRGNYTCRASNPAGERSMVVGLEVEAPNHGLGGRGWSTSSGHISRSGDSINNAGINQYGFTNGDTSKLGSNNGYSDHNGRIRNFVPNTGANIATSGSNPPLRSDSRDVLNRPVSGISVGVSVARNIGIKADNIGINGNGPGVMSSSNSVGNNHSTVRGDSVERNPGAKNNEVNVEKAGKDATTSGDNGRISGTSSNVGVFSSSVSNNGAGTNTVVGVVTSVKQRAVKGQTVLLPCPSQGSPPPRLAWLLPGNGVLPAPYYGSRLTVHRNGSLELRGVRVSDGGTLVCVVRGERGQTRIEVELEVSEPQEEARSPHRGPAVERPVQGSRLIEAPRSGASLDLAQSLSSRPVLPEMLHPRIPVTQKPLHKAQSLPAAPRPVGPPPRSTSLVSEPAVSTRTAPLVSIINGETLRLPCPASHTSGFTQGSLSWTMPSGKALSRGKSADSGKYQVQEDGTLTVQQASVFDRGTYTCRSTSGDSSSVSVITVPVIVIAYPPRITTGPSPVTYTRTGVAVELPCLTIATPRATVTWEAPDLTQLRVMAQARIYGNRYLSPQGSLVIQNPSSRDTGFYKCTAKNVIGVDTKATYLHVI
ncbi:immunoglobulin superfamily member 10-like [Sebastes umbrosus]|uniref:immunoglobulin superfamily member 10-like n=1 Tax=Sebastes umbrosus TaxID=72105 RepID=UPI0018A0863E|nr:immunoglobulin superfamily member 10-like [Sebastes umbrosus]XP_037646667.1 immunoglobulin superfamily member 10-like [Sebastes umbrosus]